MTDGPFVIRLCHHVKQLGRLDFPVLVSVDLRHTDAIGASRPMRAIEISVSFDLDLLPVEACVIVLIMSTSRVHAIVLSRALLL